MKNEDIIAKLNKIHLREFDLEELNKIIQDQKLIYVNDGQQEEAKVLWIYQTIVEVHKLYVNAFTLLKSRSYYQAWCQLERVEIILPSLKRHFSYDKKLYFLWHIETSVKNLY